MNRTGILRFVATAAIFSVTMAMSQQASAGAPVFSYYPIAASGCATSLSAWKGGDTWITGCGSSGDNTIWELIRSRSQPEQFQQRNFAAKQVAVDPASNTGLPANVWALTTAGLLYQYTSSQTWTKYFSQPSCTRAMGVGWNKEVWIIECNNTIAYLSSGATFISKGAAPETMVQVAVPLNGGNPWFIAQSGNIYMYNNTWTKESGCARSIGIGGDGVPWITACGTNASGNLYRWNGSSFAQVVWNTQLNLKAIAVSYENIPWGLGDGTSYPVGNIIERTAELDFKNDYVPQVESEWCWAATAESAYDYLSGTVDLGGAQQCTLVGGVLGRTDCCNANQPCNQPGHEYNMFNYLGIKFTRIPNIPDTWEGLDSDFSASSPVIADYEPTAGGVGHSEIAVGMYAYGGVQYVERWNPEPVGMGTLETATYPLFATPSGYFTDWTLDGIHY